MISYSDAISIIEHWIPRLDSPDDLILAEKLRAIQQNRPAEATDAEILKQYFDVLIQGSPRRVLGLNTAIFGASYGATVAVSPAINAMTHLPLVWLKLAANIGFGSAALLTALTGYFIEQTGGLTCLRVQRFFAILGTLGLIASTASIDFASIERPDWRFGLLLMEVVCINAIYPASLLVSNALLWYPPENKGLVLSTFSGLGGLGPGINLILLYYLSAGIGLSNTFIFFFCVMILPSVLAMFLTYPSPHHQLTHRGFSYEDARIVAFAYGQRNFPRPPTKFLHYFEDLKHCITDIRTLHGIASCYLVFGMFTYLSATLYITLNKTLGFSTEKAAIIAGISSIGSSFLRSITGPIIDRFASPSMHNSGFKPLLTGYAVNAILLLIIANYSPSNASYAPSFLGSLFCLLQSSSGINGIANAKLALTRQTDPQYQQHPAGSSMSIMNTVATGAPIGLYLTQVLCQTISSTHGDCIFYNLIACLTLLLLASQYLLQTALEAPPNRYHWFRPTPVLTAAPSIHVRVEPR